MHAVDAKKIDTRVWSRKFLKIIQREFCLQCRDVQKTEILFGFGFENRAVQRFDIRSNGFPIETARNPPFRLKVTKSNFTRNKCADKERFKTRPKQSLGFRMQLHYLLVVVVSDIKVMSSTVVVTFAVN